MPTKTKVSVTVDRALLRAVERLAGRMSRSEVFERALAGWVRRRGQAELDRAVEAYYRAQPAAERDAEQDWAALGDDTVREGWDD